MPERDLFGNEVAEEARPVFGEKPKRRTTPAKGYAASPGTGPEGEACRTCRFLVAKHMAKIYHKCALMRHCWSGGRGTDVLVKSLACSRWEKI